MKIYVNGESRETESPNMQKLLQELQLLPTQVAIEYNGTVLFHHELSQTQLHDGDRIEMIRVVAGG